ncbi:hypothetical protein HAZT_HAZT011761 [Hyalella azteca]|uniref:Protein OSCP1 n=1 Tax=Hyalella azteca TaxID=294128 RepID=A0A6A0GVY2_HYAAZ|nr:hypothetical protein HAZT_HAZT011761 [Hyalella azteca]
MVMVDHGLPLQFLNLGGEMLYIIDQRLRAQEVPPDRAAKVRNDILSIMLNRRFIEEVFKPQPLYSRAALRGVFERLAHGSIMRLNAVSMDKVRRAAAQCCQHGQGDLAEIRRLLLEFVQDLNTRVSIFLREGIQTAEGRFVLPVAGPVPPSKIPHTCSQSEIPHTCSPNTEMPGLIRYFDSAGELTSTSYFPHGGDFQPPESPGSLDPSPRPRGTNLGINLEEGQSVELNLLAQLLKPASAQATFRLNLFLNEDDAADDGADDEPDEVVHVKPDASRAPELQQLLQQFSLEENQDQDMDLLELLDSTN